ncbi:hypothetical protein SAMN02910263_02758 [Butyrivibrio sp. INlla16]|nr:hypothetical protein SAMN02910263_02758 [Butyrivibrio sp. INlla16]
MCEKLDVRISKKLSITILIIVFLLASVFIVVNAGSKKVVMHGFKYEIEDKNGFDSSRGKKIEKFAYGKNSIGELSVNGAKEASGKHGGFYTYGATEEVTLSFSYDGAFHTDTKEDWNITSSDEKTVNGCDISKQVKQGAIVVQQSKNGKDWVNAQILCDCFKKKPKDLLDFYIIPKEDILEGLYYRVLIAYKMGRKTGTEKQVFFSTDVFEYRNFLEVYDFYVCYGENPVVFTDIQNGTVIKSNSTVEKGFVVNKSGTEYAVSIKKDGGKEKRIDDLTSITEPGDYDITIISDTGAKYYQKIKIAKGIKLSKVNPMLYEGGKKGKYQIEEPVKGKGTFGKESLAVLKIGQDANTNTVTAEKDGFNGYGIVGTSASIYLNVSARDIPDYDDWEIYADNYGKKENEKIGLTEDSEGVYVGPVDKGALAVQKSSDGITWKDEKVITKTTDFYNYYGEKGDTLIYTPDGKDVLNGVYLKIYFAYELYQKSTKTYDKCIEVYKVYLCNSDLDAVTYNNMTVKDDVIKAQIGEEKAYQIEVYKDAQSLRSGSCSVSGFEINTKQNPTVTYTVKHDGNNIAIPSDHKFTASGRYDISLKGALGNTAKVTLYVDRMTAKQAFEKYFSDGFIEGVRIYSEGNYPVFEGGKTKYRISDIEGSFLPVNGTIKNITTNHEVKINGNRDSKEGTLRTPGEYVATFSTAQTDAKGKLPGDYRVFTYHFNVIEEGTAPGPVNNKKALYDYAQTSMSDSYPMYYGLTYPSATKGDITLAFLDKDAALDFEYEYDYPQFQIISNLMREVYKFCNLPAKITDNYSVRPQKARRSASFPFQFLVFVLLFAGSCSIEAIASAIVSLSAYA